MRWPPPTAPNITILSTSVARFDARRGVAVPFTGLGASASAPCLLVYASCCRRHSISDRQRTGGVQREGARTTAGRAAGCSSIGKAESKIIAVSVCDAKIGTAWQVLFHEKRDLAIKWWRVPLIYL